MQFSKKSLKILIMHRWKVPGALHRPKGILLWAKVPTGQVNVVFFLILKSNSDLHITRKTIKETVVRFTCHAFKHLVNEWQWKMVLFGNLVQLPIVDAYSPTVLHPSRNQLILLIFYHGEAGFLRNYLDGTHPLAVGDRINDSSLQKLGYLLLHYIKNHWVEYSLSLSYWFSPIL